MILLDTDVLVDSALERRPHSDLTIPLMRQLEQTPGRMCVAWHTVSNLYYLVSRDLDSQEARRFITELTRFAQIAPTDTEALRYALSLPMTDFEDAMQVAAARACGASYIVTRNIRDYRRSPIPAITPAEALRL